MTVRYLIFASFAFAMQLTAGEVLAQMTVSPNPEPNFEARMAATGGAEDADIEFAALETLEEADAALINGVPADPEVFPAVIRMTTGGTCTASIIGPATVLLAAHCVKDGAAIRFSADGTTVRGICDQAPGYRSGDKSHDWALCLLSRRVKGIAFETVNLGTPVGIGVDVLLSGYGCKEQGGKSIKKLLIGVSKTVGRPAGLSPEASTIYSKSEIESGGAVLCPGDSGGPVFRLIDGAVDGKRLVEGVNSRTTYDVGVSLFSAIGSEAGVAFVRRWTSENSQPICGLALSGSGTCQGD